MVQAKLKKLKKMTRWMNMENVRSLRFWDVTFPGTHNSATWCCYFNKEFKWSIENNAFIKLYVACQKLTVYKQLACGIRFLDLRVCKPYGKKKEPYCAHNVNSLVLSIFNQRKVLTQIRMFCRRNPSEVIIISIRRDMSHLNDMKSLGLIESDFLVALLLRCYLGPALTENITIGELADRNQRVIYFFEEQERFLPPNINSTNISSSGKLNVMLRKKFWRCVDDKQKVNRQKKKEKIKHCVSSKTTDIEKQETIPFQQNTQVMKKKEKSLKKICAEKTNRTRNEFDGSIVKNIVESTGSKSGTKAKKYKDTSEANTLKPLMSLWLKRNVSKLWYPRLESLPKNVYKGLINKNLNKTYRVKKVNSRKFKAERSLCEQAKKKTSLKKSKQIQFDINDEDKKSVMDFAEKKFSKLLVSNTQEDQFMVPNIYRQKYNSVPSLQHMWEGNITNFALSRSINKNRQEKPLKKTILDFFSVRSLYPRTKKDNLLVKWSSSGLNPVLGKHYHSSVQRNINELSGNCSSESEKNLFEFSPTHSEQIVTSGVRKSRQRFSNIGDLKIQTCESEVLGDTLEKDNKLETVKRKKKNRLKKTLKKGLNWNKATRSISLTDKLRSVKDYPSKPLTNLRSQRSRGRMRIKNGLSYIALNRLVSQANICGGGYFHAMLTPFMCGATRMFKSWSDTSDSNPVTLCAKLVKWSLCYGSARPRVPFVLRILAGEVTPPSFEFVFKIFKTVQFWTSCFFSTLVSDHAGLEAYGRETHKILLESVLTDDILNNINCITHDFANKAVTLRIINSNSFVPKNK